MGSRRKQRDAAGDPQIKAAVLDPVFKEHLSHWRAHNPVLADKLMRLVAETCRSPFTGIGKPEALKENWSGCWSRRLTQEHRLIYRVHEKTVEFIRAYGHY